jgi:hypothetical protein
VCNIHRYVKVFIFSANRFFAKTEVIVIFYSVRRSWAALNGKYILADILSAKAQYVLFLECGQGVGNINYPEMMLKNGSRCLCYLHCLPQSIQVTRCAVLCAVTCSLENYCSTILIYDACLNARSSLITASHSFLQTNLVCLIDHLSRVLVTLY